MSRKHSITCDRCGFEEETDGVNLKSINPVTVAFGLHGLTVDELNIIESQLTFAMTKPTPPIVMPSFGPTPGNLREGD